MTGDAPLPNRSHSAAVAYVGALAMILALGSWLWSRSLPEADSGSLPAERVSIAPSEPPVPVTPRVTTQPRCDAPAPIGELPEPARTALSTTFPCCAPSTQDVVHMLARLALRVPFAYAHFNDGEIIAATATSGVTDRGLQTNSEGLKERMRAALQVDAEGAYFGAPCVQYFGHARLQFDDLAIGCRNRTRKTIATAFIDGNYKAVRRVLPELLKRRGDAVHLIVSEEADIGQFSTKTGITPHSVHRVPKREAFPAGYDAVRGAARGFGPGDVVILCAGPLGRILAAEWFVERPCATYLELGSFFDPELLGRSLGAGYYDDSFDPANCERQGDVRASVPEAELLDLVAAK